MKRIFLGLLLAVTAACQPAKAPPAPAPIITAEQRAAFWRAFVDKSKADAAYDAAVRDLQATCAKLPNDQVVTPDQRGEPSCAPKPKEAKK